MLYTVAIAICLTASALHQLTRGAGSLARLAQQGATVQLAARVASDPKAVRTHGPAVRRMFRDALASLDDRQRDLLRLEILDGLPHQQIAELHGVHRTTVVRWMISG